ncbi:hypothetical protein BDQ17DRAFT_515026 [Cyathus striatus]|nr:hypothetical protein BDQ17DRAFT_515026 [Cyathus striatus]
MPPSTTSIPIQQKHCIWPWCNVPLDPAYAVAGVCERCMTRRIALGASEAASARYGPVPPQRNLSTTAPPYTPFHTFPQRNDPIPSSSTLQPVDLVGERIRARFPQSYPPREVIPSTSQLVDLVGERERKRMEAGLYSIDDAANMLHIKYLDPQYQLANLPSSVHSHITQQKQARRETQNPYPRVGVMIPSSTPLVPIPIPVLAQSLSGPPVPQRTQTPRLPQLQIPQTPRIPPLPQISPSPQPQSRPESQSPMVQPYPSPSQSHESSSPFNPHELSFRIRLRAHSRYSCARDMGAGRLLCGDAGWVVLEVCCTCAGA